MLHLILNLNEIFTVEFLGHPVDFCDFRYVEHFSFIVAAEDTQVYSDSLWNLFMQLELFLLCDSSRELLIKSV
jgi:hypothetical protein